MADHKDVRPDDQPRSPCLVAALDYAARGWFVFFAPPGLKSGVMGRDDEGSSGRPWSNSRDPEHLKWQFAKRPGLNVCIATGKDSGLLILDVDNEVGHEHDGFAVIAQWKAEGLHLPETLMAESWSGGRHYYFEYDDSKSGRIGSQTIADGVDVKGDGGMVIAPPSVFKKKGEYRWLNPGVAVAPAPLWLFGKLRALRDEERAEQPKGEAIREWSVEEIARAMSLIPNEALAYDEWVKIGMALYAWNSGDDGFLLFDKWSQKSAKYKPAITRDVWYRRFKGSPPERMSIGTIIYKADAVDPYWLAALGDEIDARFAAATAAPAGVGPPPPPPPPAGSPPPALGASHYGIRDFVSHLVTHKYIYRPSGDLCPASAVDGCLPPIPGKGKKKKATRPTAWLDRNQQVAQMTWAPGEPEFICDRIIKEKGGWLKQPGVKVYNRYIGPPASSRRAGPVQRWLDHIAVLFGEEARDKQILPWYAHRVQRPGEKINHALVFGGKSGIGKDCIIQPLKMAVGPWNFGEAGPQDLLNRFNTHLQNVVLRVNEAHDIGEFNRWSLYDHMKDMIASPPDVLMIDDKNIPKYAIPNIVSIIITTNHRTEGLILVADDRRHYVLWSEKTREDFPTDPEAYWNPMWHWYEHDGGYQAIADYLAHYDLSGFDPKAPPPKTEAFWEIVAASQAPENGDMADALDHLNWPAALYLEEIWKNATPEFSDWMRDPKNNRQVPRRLETCGYSRLRNPRAEDGLYKIGDRRRQVYFRRNAPPVEVQQRLELMIHRTEGEA